MSSADTAPDPGSLVIAVDGTSGSGKSSTSRGVAERLGLRYLDTGAMFRAMTWWLLREGVDVRDAAAVAADDGVLERVELLADLGQETPEGVGVEGDDLLPHGGVAAGHPGHVAHALAGEREVLGRRAGEAGRGQDGQQVGQV